MTLHSLKETKLSIADKKGNFYTVALGEELPIDESEILWSKQLYPFVALFDDNMKPIEEVNEYLKSKLSKGQEINTALSKGYDLKEFYTFLELVKISFSDVKARHINDFIAFLMHPDSSSTHILKATSKRTGKTINRIISTIRNFYQYLSYFYGVEDPFENEGIAIRMPHKAREGLFAHLGKGQVVKSIFKVKESKRDIKILTHKEYESLINHFKLKRDRLIFQFMFFTGARIGEALSLKIQNIKTFDASKQVQIIELSKPIENESNRRRLKTGPRKLYVPNHIYYELNNYYQAEWNKIWDKTEFEHDYFFIGEGKTNYGNPLSYAAIYKIFKEAGVSTGITFTPHDLRHTFATNLARNKVDISTIQKLLGHKNPSTCSIYIELAKEQDIAKELEKIFDKMEYGIFDE